MSTGSVRRWSAPAVAARGVTVMLWLLALIASAEVLLQGRAAWLDRFVRDDSPLGQLDRAYAAFSAKHLHPHYLFFFPLRPADRLAMATATGSLDADGFREPGPAHANGRKLAFVLGGSAAFGYYASSNATTITSYMNALQSEYFFVNAGVPSWISTQELYRLAMDIAARRPALVISYGGANDAASADMAHPATGLAYPAGTPESFDDLEVMAESASRGLRLTPAALLPELMHRWDKYRTAWFGEEVAPAADPARFDAAADRYLANLEQMAALTRSAGGRFVAVFQPVAGLHTQVPATPSRLVEARAGFHERVMTTPRTSFELHDLSAVFDPYFAAVPVARDPAGEVLSPDSVFFDSVHLQDRGNEIVAAHLLRLITSPPPQ